MVMMTSACVDLGLQTERGLPKNAQAMNWGSRQRESPFWQRTAGHAGVPGGRWAAPDGCLIGSTAGAFALLEPLLHAPGRNRGRELSRRRASAHRAVSRRLGSPGAAGDTAGRGLLGTGGRLLAGCALHGNRRYHRRILFAWAHLVTQHPSFNPPRRNGCEASVTMSTRAEIQWWFQARWLFLRHCHRCLRHRCVISSAGVCPSQQALVNSLLAAFRDWQLKFPS
mmetsp:Transcript_38497/g.71238  ORF Transcript_38497/g.71238 Transcript_38497/m.71238 type:complete len:225 (+) Transcript_38497:3-677(+)